MEFFRKVMARICLEVLQLKMNPIIIVREKLWANVIGITIWPFIFLKKGFDTQRVINHEKIHIKQQQECLILPFYLLYFLSWIICLFFTNDPYRNIPFEREAHENDDNLEYLKHRRAFSWIKYILKNNL